MVVKLYFLPIFLLTEILGVQPEILFLVTLDSHPFPDHQACAQDHQQKMSKYASSPRIASVCLTIEREESVMWKKIFLKPCPLFYWESKSQKGDFPNICSGTRKAGPPASESWHCQKRPMRGRTGWHPNGTAQMEGRLQQVQERQLHGTGQVPSSLGSHLHMSICFVTVVWFIAFQRVN